MSEQTPGPNLLLISKAAAPYLPGLGGAALSMMFGQALTVCQKLVSLIAGVASALFVAPGLSEIANVFIPGAVLPEGVAGLIGFTCGLFGMTAIATLMTQVPKWLHRLKIRLGPIEIDGGP